MTLGDDRRATASSAAPQLDGTPYGEEVPNPFRPVSMENRITGSAGGYRGGVQPTPGTSYGYGWSETPAVPESDPYAAPGWPQPGADAYEGYPAEPYGFAAQPPQMDFSTYSCEAPPLPPVREIDPGMDATTDPWEEMGWKPPQNPGGAVVLPPYEEDIFYSEPRRKSPSFVPGADTQPFYPLDSTLMEQCEARAAKKRGPEKRADGAPPAKKPPVQKQTVTKPSVQKQPVKKPATPAPANVKMGKHGWRLGVTIVVALLILFGVVEIAKMVTSLMTSEQSRDAERAEYYALAGVDPDRAPVGVQVLPAGQTYAPTATPAPAATATPAPRIDQNDPLIGVVDAGGTASEGDTDTATRTKLSRYPNNPLLSIDTSFADLREANEDIVAVLTIDGVLSETVVQRNNTYYLTHNARGAFSAGGAVFVDEGCSLTKPPENLLLRGQTTVEGKLFAPIAQYGTQGADFVSSHGIVTCRTIYENAQYVVFAVIRADTNPASADYFNYSGSLTFRTDAQMLAYVQNARQHSLYPIDVSVKASDRLLTLATLPQGDGTTGWVVLCRMLRDGERTGSIQREGT